MAKRQREWGPRGRFYEAELPGAHADRGSVERPSGRRWDGAGSGSRGRYFDLPRNSHNIRPRPRRFGFVHDEDGVQRKYVRGGRIAKVRKVKEDPGDDKLFCEACGYYLPDANAKALHDKGRKHRQVMEEQREKLDMDGIRESLDSRQEDMRRRAPEPDVTTHMSEQSVLETLKDIAGPQTPNSFKSWAERSLAAARKQEIRTGDSLVTWAVQREIAYEYATHYDNCTLLQESWDRRPPATGRCYMTKDPVSYREPVVPNNEVPKLYATAPSALPSRRTNAEPGDGSVLSQSQSAQRERSFSPRQRSVSPPSRRWVRGTVEGVKKADEAHVASDVEPADSEDELRLRQSAAKTPPAHVQQDQIEKDKHDALAKVEMTWVVSRGAARILYSCQGKRPNAIVARFRSVFPKLKSHSPTTRRQAPRQDSALDSSRPEELRRQYEKLKAQYMAETYESVAFESEANTIISLLDAVPGHSNIVRDCCEMLVRNAIQNSEFEKIIEPLSRLVELYDGVCRRSPTRREFIGHWIVSLLLKPTGDKGDTARKPLDQVALAARLRAIPKACIRTSGARHGLDVLRALLSNNYVAFMRLYDNSEFHFLSQMRGQYLMDAFLPFVRQRALLVYGSPSAVERTLVYQHPARISLHQLMEQLKWYYDLDGSSERAWLANQARNEISSLGLLIESVSGASGALRDDGSEEYLVARDCEATIRPAAHIDADTILRFVPKIYTKRF